MSKFPELAAIAVFGVLCTMTAARAGGDAAAGKAVFQRCAVCHRVGPNAKNAIGPELNNVIGRTAGTAKGYTYSPAMKKKGENGLVWSAGTLAAFLTNPMKDVPGTKMGFAGLHSDTDRQNIIAYLKTFSTAGKTDSSSATPAGKTEETTTASSAASNAKPASSGNAAVRPVSHTIPKHGVYHLGRKALPAEVAAWNVDIRPDGTGLPAGHGTAARGEKIFTRNCASCHGDFGEGVGRWPVLAGGQGSLKKDRPVKTVGSYWPYLSTVYDYIRRAMPFGNAHSLSNDDVYALTAYVLYLNYIVPDEDFDLSNRNFTTIKMPNADGFIMDNRRGEPEYAKKSGTPCMKNCKSETVKITMEAQVLNVTPDADQSKADTGHGIE